MKARVPLAFLGGLIVGVLATDLRTNIVDTATAVAENVPATVVHQQIPVAFILVRLYVLVRDLPQQGIEILH